MGSRIYLLMEGKLASGGNQAFQAYLSECDTLMANHGVGIWSMGQGINPLPEVASWQQNLVLRFPDLSTAQEYFAETQHQQAQKHWRDQAFRELSVSLFKVELFGNAPRANWLVAMERPTDKPKKEPRSISRKELGSGTGLETDFTTHLFPHLVLQVFDHEDGLKRYFEGRSFAPRNLTIFKAAPPNFRD